MSLLSKNCYKKIILESLSDKKIYTPEQLLDKIYKKYFYYWRYNFPKQKIIDDIQDLINTRKIRYENQRISSR